MNSRQQLDGQRTLDEALGAALSDERDGILPSSGFADSVMAAVRSNGPAPLRFPWKRALPGLIAGIVALVGFAGGDVWVLARMPASSWAASSLSWRTGVMQMLGRADNPAVLWTLVALLIPLVSLWLTRRLLFSR